MPHWLVTRHRSTEERTRDRDEIILQIAELRRLRAGYERQGKHRFVSYIEQMLGEAEAELRQHDKVGSPA